MRGSRCFRGMFFLPNRVEKLDFEIQTKDIFYYLELLIVSGQLIRAVFCDQELLFLAYFRNNQCPISFSTQKGAFMDEREIVVPHCKTQFIWCQQGL